MWKELRALSAKYRGVLGNDLLDTLRSRSGFVVSPKGEILHVTTEEAAAYITDGCSRATAAQIAEFKLGVSSRSKAYVVRRRLGWRDRQRRHAAGLGEVAADLERAIDEHPPYDPRRATEPEYLSRIRAYISRVKEAARKIGVDPLRVSDARDFELLAQWQLDSRSPEWLADVPYLRSERARLKRELAKAPSETVPVGLKLQLNTAEDALAEAQYEARRLRNRLPALAAEIGLPPRKPPRRGRPRKGGS